MEVVRTGRGGIGAEGVCGVLGCPGRGRYELARRTGRRASSSGRNWAEKSAPTSIFFLASRFGRYFFAGTSAPGSPPFRKPMSW